jgi:hypothetical protein
MAIKTLCASFVVVLAILACVLGQQTAPNDASTPPYKWKNRGFAGPKPQSQTAHKHSVEATPVDGKWRNKDLTPQERAQELISAMTLEEKLVMVHGSDNSYGGVGI